MKLTSNSALGKVFVSLALAFSLGSAPALAGANFPLLTPDETTAYMNAPQPDDDLAEDRAIAMVRADGPGIRVAAPSGFKLRSPVNFDIRIQPKDGIPVVMSSLKIEYRLGPIWTDVTGRLAGHGSVIGTQLKANGADLPLGKHQIRLTVTDSENRKTQAVVKFAVVQ
ncbi:hypothetical protein [Falsiphaeobacter marinintestinus]|uniref:hypothetical protein n=1 Tax=Falsiphaeobacter marinintestinus TaxID=1492905 RepID=UPI0011B811BD|nr:hypothetical protein [Phaeobacter marinintestinus]